VSRGLAYFPAAHVIEFVWSIMPKEYLKLEQLLSTAEYLESILHDCETIFLRSQLLSQAFAAFDTYYI